jgi:hypothetical protein
MENFHMYWSLEMTATKVTAEEKQMEFEMSIGFD